MPKSSQYRDDFVERVRQSRTEAALTQDQIAELLGMTQGKYKTYEQATLLPHGLIERFCWITRTNPLWLLTGKGNRRAAVPAVEPRRSTSLRTVSSPRKA